MITTIKQDGKQFVVSTALLFGLRKEDEMNNGHGGNSAHKIDFSEFESKPFDIEEAIKNAKQLSILLGDKYADFVNANIHRADYRDLVVSEVERLGKIKAEQEQQAAEARDIVEDWFGESLDIAERVGQEQKDFAEFQANVKWSMLDAADLQATQDDARL